MLRGYEGEDIEIQLPGNLTVYDIDYLSIWCVKYAHDFGHVLIPPARELWVPPALGQTRIKVGLSVSCRCYKYFSSTLIANFVYLSICKNSSRDYG